MDPTDPTERMLIHEPMEPKERADPTESPLPTLRKQSRHKNDPTLSVENPERMDRNE